MNVTRVLLDRHRTIVLWIAAITVVVVSIGLVAITRAGPMKFSFWLVMAGSIAKYWPLAVGITLVSMHFRLFVTNGVTRREFLVAVAVCGLIFAAGFGLAVTAGHAVESAVLGLADQRAAGYPSPDAGEIGRVLPLSLGYFTTGVLISASFYRFGPLIGLALIIPSSLPGAVAEGLLDLDEFGNGAGLLPYAPALAITLAVIALAGAATWAALRDVPIRRATR